MTIWLAYVRGNDRLQGKNGEDIGSRILFGGPVLNPREPERSQNLRSKSSADPFNSDTHTYRCKWEYGD